MCDLGKNNKEIVRLLGLVSDGLYVSKIAKILGVNRSTISRKLKRLEAKDLIRKKKEGWLTTYVLKRTGKKLIATKSCCLFGQGVKQNQKESIYSSEASYHATRLKSRILNNKSNLKGYHRLTGMTLRITGSNVIMDIEPVMLENDLEFESNLSKHIESCFNVAYAYLLNRGLKLSRDYKHIYQHVADEVHKEIDKRVLKHRVVKVSLARKSKGVTGAMKTDAMAWGDKSRGSFEVESNDLEYKRDMIVMPQRVRELKEELALLTEAMKLQIESQSFLINNISNRGNKQEDTKRDYR